MILEDFGSKSRVMEKVARMLQFLNAIFAWFQKHDFTKITGPNDWRIVVSINNARLPLEFVGPNRLLINMNFILYFSYEWHISS